MHMLSITLVTTFALAVIAIALFTVIQMDAKRQDKWRREKLKSIDAKKAKIAARKRRQSGNQE